MEDKSEELASVLWDMTTTMCPNTIKDIMAAAKYRRAYGPYMNQRNSTFGTTGLPKLGDHAAVGLSIGRKEQICQIPKRRSDNRGPQHVEFLSTSTYQR